MVCPAVSDPFSGPYYRIIACCHQPLLIFLVGKIFCIVGHQFVKALYGEEGQKVEWQFRDDINNYITVNLAVMLALKLCTKCIRTVQ